VFGGKFRGHLGSNYLLPLIPIGMMESLAFTFPETFVLSQTIGPFTLEGILACVLFVCAYILWLPFVALDTWPRIALVMFWGLILVWLIANFASFYHGQSWYWSQASFVVPLALLMILLKRPPMQSVITALDFLAFLIILILGIRLATDIHSQVISLSSLFEISLSNDRGARWYGLVGNPNAGAPLGAFLILWALVRRGKLGFVFVATGLLILLLTLSRTVIFSLLVAVAVTAIYSKRERMRKLSTRQSWTVGLILVLGFTLPVFLILLSDPTVNLRTPVWAHHWGLMTSNLPTTLLSGFGETNAAWLGSTDGWFGASEPHNVLLSVAVRYGIFNIVAVVVVATAALFVALEGARRGRVFGIGLWVFVVLVSLTEDQIAWRYLDFTVMLLIFVPLSAAAPQNAEEEPSYAKTESVS
jgi:hypothetical protein